MPPGTLLVVPDVLPAGTYALVARDSSTARGTASLVIGRNARPLSSWNLPGDLRDGVLQFNLPVDVGSIVVTGDAEAQRSGVSLSMRPIALLPGTLRLTHSYARRAEPYGPAFVYFFDDAVFPEKPGFWVRGGADARFAIMSVQPGQPLQLFIRNAAVRNRVTVKIDDAPQTLDLQPREERPLRVAAKDHGRASLVEIISDAGFHPSDVEQGSTDTRYLGAWVELRP
jgi:hypothetical protein